LSNNANKPSLLRIFVPLIVALVGVMVILSLMNPPKEDPDATDTDTPIAQQPGQAPADADDPDDATEGPDPATADTGEEDADTEPSDPVDETDPATAEATDEDDDSAEDNTGILSNLRPAFPDTFATLGSEDPKDIIKIGSADPESGYELFAEINPYRACVHRVTLSNVKQDVAAPDRYILLHPVDLSRKGINYPTIGSYAAQSIQINSIAVPLATPDPGGAAWLGHWNVESTSDKHATLSLTIQGGPDDAPVDVVKITRTYRVAPESHTIVLDQNVENLTDEQFSIKWGQLAQSDVHYETNDYLRGRSRQYVTGYFRDDYDESRFSIYVDDGFIARPDLIGKLKDTDNPKWKSVWPNPKVNEGDNTLAWLASENRYFVVISSPHIKADTQETGDVPALEEVYPKISTTIYPDAKADKDLPDDARHVLIGLTSQSLQLKPGQSTQPADLSLDLFVGPREDVIFAQAPYKAMKFEKTIRYSLGGFCGVCTFQWLANLLLSFLELLHSVVFDWGIAIVILVIVVRLILHPLTKRGQIGMMKMGKQMAAVQPEIAKLKKKYADDPRQMQAEQMKLFREKGINPASGALGCLPMFLQMPIWIALYAMLYYAIELRHEPAFYGVFQAFADWPFLADLSSADRFIPLFANDGGHVFNLLFIRLDYSSINILPILMGITFFINMKFTTPPPMNDQQATQQKIMRVMPLLFPFFLYSAPAGLTLYICASTMAGIVDSYIVRKHVRELEESGDLFKPKERKPGGFMDRLQKAAEAKQAQMEELKKQQNKGPQNYKKRKR